MAFDHDRVFFGLFACIESVVSVPHIFLWPMFESRRSELSLDLSVETQSFESGGTAQAACSAAGKIYQTK